MLQWSGEIAAQLPTKTMALLRDRLLAEASTAAWQDFFWFNAWVAIICLFPALPYWRRKKYSGTAVVQTGAGSPARASPRNGASKPQD
jgi:hypothetical protein